MERSGPSHVRHFLDCSRIAGGEDACSEGSPGIASRHAAVRSDGHGDDCGRHGEVLIAPPGIERRCAVAADPLLYRAFAGTSRLLYAQVLSGRASYL